MLLVGHPGRALMALSARRGALGDPLKQWISPRPRPRPAGSQFVSGRMPSTYSVISAVDGVMENVSPQRPGG